MKTIFVVGAGKGLGNGVAEKFAEQGFKVVLFSRSEKNLAKYAADFAEKYFEVSTQPADVTDFAGFAKNFQSALKKFGTSDVLFYNVGITSPDDKENLNAEKLVEHYIADVAGAYNAIKLVTTAEFISKGGAILITGGGLALQPYFDYSPLSMDKAALCAMIQAMSPILKEQGIYIGTVQITGVIGSNAYFSPKAIAEKFWGLYEKRVTHEIIY